MQKLDNKLTQQIADWLNTPEADRDVRAGADLMLSLNRNRALYNSILRRPDKFMAKLVYELRKFLRMRLDAATAADAAKLEREVMPRVEKSLAHPTISSDDELPDAQVAKGKRPDHDSLPADIRALWDTNGQLYRRIVLLFNELKAMADEKPCDRYEKLCILDEADKSYRANFERYDSFVAPADADSPEAGDPVAPADADSPEAGDPVAPAELTDSTDNVVKAVGAARKRISTYVKRVSDLDPDDPKRLDLISKIQSAVDVILSSGSDVSESTKQKLQALGISSQ